MKYKDFKMMSKEEMKKVTGGNFVSPTGEEGCGSYPAIYQCLGRWHMPSSNSAECPPGSSSGRCGATTPGWECCGACTVECVTPE